MTAVIMKESLQQAHTQICLVNKGQFSKNIYGVMLLKMFVKRLFFVVTVLAVGLPFLFSCKNNVEETSSVQEADVPEGKCALSVCPELSLFCDDFS